MALSRTRQKELKKLKRSADDLWDQQREALDQASYVLREATRQARALSREEVAPRVAGVYSDHVQPVVATGIAGARTASGAVKDKVVGDVIPALSGAVGSAIAVIEAVRDPRVREVVRSAARSGGKIVPIAQPKKGPGPGTFILIGLGVVAVAAVGYAAWQTLRADEDLWIEDLADVGAIDVGEDDDEDEF
ncbi:hypothetical protein [Protaetiibacter mangrovi]|uniref:DNA helicase n=1 Tax=Protaetiibacter mangrovi TaxID=2970926 RepID=A0ABT1ZHD2_9MICO|nr:hypothetical protein [Protaetiibacter mangrovi]MCS0500105.1 hypothetical protein [Protaetiibacter mangrovi]TPX02406.1 hypothetical protein FJ656_22550 [Schumannella luteola]